MSAWWEKIYCRFPVGRTCLMMYRNESMLSWCVERRQHIGPTEGFENLFYQDPVWEQSFTMKQQPHNVLVIVFIIVLSSLQISTRCLTSKLHITLPVNTGSSSHVIGGFPFIVQSSHICAESKQLTDHCLPIGNCFRLIWWLLLLILRKRGNEKENAISPSTIIIKRNLNTLYSWTQTACRHLRFLWNQP